MMGKITKSTIAAGFASIVLLLSGCPLLPPPNNAPTLDPKQTSITINEAQNLFLEGKVSDDNSSLDQILFEVSSDRFAFSSVEKTLPDNFSIEGSPKDKNYYGSTHMEISATDHNGARITFRIPITIKDTPDLVVTDWPTSIEVDKGQTFQITFKLTDDYSDWNNGITKSFVCDKYNIVFEAISATDGRLTFTPKDPGYVGTTGLEMTVSDDEGNTTNKTLEIVVNDVVNPNNPPQITGPASLSIDEGLQAVVDFTVTDDKTEFAELLIEAMSTQYNVSLERIAPNTVRVTGIPKDRNYYGNAGMTVKATDLEGSLATYALPITVKDTPDLVVTDWPTSIEVGKGQTFQITFKLTDDYSDWYNGIAKSFVCDKYNIAFEAINATDGMLTFTPKDPGYVGTTDFGMTISDDEGNTVDRSLEIIINDVANSKPTIEIPDFTIKEGENKDITVKITDEDPLSQLEVAVSSDKYNVSYQKVNDTDLLITFTKLNDEYNGPAGITVQATDTQNLSEKVTKTFQVTPMTDLELKILGQTLNVSGGIVVGSQISNQSNVNVKVYQRDVNWMEKEEYGDLYHYRIGIDSALSELLFQGTTNSQGNIKFQVDPKAYDEALLYVVLSKSGFLDKTRHFFADTDLGSTSLILSQDNPLINEWLYYSLCNNGYQPMDGGVYIPKGNVAWRHQIFPSFPRPNVVVVKGDNEYVAQNVLDAIPEAVEHVFGPGYSISYSSELGTPQENTIYVEFWDYQIGQVWISTLPVSNLMKLGGINVGREYPLEEQIFSSLIHEFGHLLFINAHKENMDSHYRQDSNFSTYPYLSGLDKAVQQLVLAVGNMLPGDKYVYEGSSLKQLSFAVLKGDKVYYLQYE